MVKNLPVNAEDMEMWVQSGTSWVGKIPWSRKWQPTPVFLPGKFHDRGTWWVTVCGAAKSRIPLSTLRSEYLYPPYEEMYHLSI